MITEKDYYKGRDVQYKSELTELVRTNSRETIRRANLLLDAFFAFNPRENRNDRGCSSGWRPAAVNATIKKAAKKSNHMLGRAIDIYDANRKLAKWLMTLEGKRALESIGLWMEHPSATGGWVHVQIVPPGSGNRYFFP